MIEFLYLLGEIEMNTGEVIRQAEETIALAKLAEALRLPEAVIVRPAGKLGSRREVVLVVEHDVAADKLVAAIKAAAGKQ